MADASDLSPLDWLARLGPKLRDRQSRIQLWQRYYDGDQDLPSGPQQHKDAYLRFQKLARTNLCKLCVDSRVHRMKVTGFRDGSAAGGLDKAVWDLWQRERLDSRQFTVYRRMFVQGEAFVIVGPTPGDEQRPRVTIESPLNVTVARDPAAPSERLAALRLWHDPYAKRWLATVWVPGQRHSYQSKREFKDADSGRLSYEAKDWQERGEVARSSQGIPVVPFTNGDEGEDPRAAFDVGLDVQNRLNLTLLNRLTAERYAAFRQRYLLNYTPEEDPATGLLVPPFNPGADQTFTIPPPEPGDPAPVIGDLAQTDTSGILRSCESDIRSFAATTITPVYYLPGGDLVNIGADSIVALDAGFVQSVKGVSASASESWEDVLQECAGIAGIERDLSSSEVVWDQPENFNPAVAGDYGTKLSSWGVPAPMIAERLGWTPQEIDRLRNEMTQASLRASLLAPAPAGAAAPGQPPVPARDPVATTPTPAPIPEPTSPPRPPV